MQLMKDKSSMAFLMEKDLRDGITEELMMEILSKVWEKEQA